MTSVPLFVVQVGQSLGWVHKMRVPVSQQVKHDKSPSQLKGHQRRAKTLTWQPFTSSGDVTKGMNKLRWTITLKFPTIDDSLFIQSSLSFLPKPTLWLKICHVLSTAGPSLMHCNTQKRPSVLSSFRSFEEFLSTTSYFLW